MSKIRRENFCTIQGWMRTELDLKGNELLAYAVIYGFSQADGQYMTCSQDYIAEWLGVNRVSANRIIKRLSEKGLISKENAKTVCKYKALVSETREKAAGVEEKKPEEENNANPDCSKKLQRCNKSIQQGVTKGYTECNKTLHNNYINNNINNNIYNHIINTIDTNIINSCNDNDNDNDSDNDNNNNTNLTINTPTTLPPTEGTTEKPSIQETENKIKELLCYDLLEDEADLALLDNVVDVLMDKVFLREDGSAINMGSKNDPDNKRVAIVRWMLEKNLNYSITLSYLRQIKTYGKPVRNPQYILKTIYSLCLGGKTINQSRNGYCGY